METTALSFICDSLSLVTRDGWSRIGSHNDWDYMKDEIKIGDERDGRSWKIGESGR
jgi:hypothetical protein